MAKSPAKKSANDKALDAKSVIESPLYVGLHTTLLPLLNILDGDTPADLDTGTDKPSQRDMGLRIFLGQMIQTISNQLYGYKTSAGQQINGSLSYLNEAEYRVNSPLFVQRAEQDNLTENDLRAWHFFEIANARVEAMTEMLRSFKAVYKQITGEEWKPYERAVASDKADATKAKQAILARAKEVGVTAK